MFRRFEPTCFFLQMYKLLGDWHWLDFKWIKKQLHNHRTSLQGKKIWKKSDMRILVCAIKSLYLAVFLCIIYQGHPTTVFSLMLLDAVLGYLDYF